MCSGFDGVGARLQEDLLFCICLLYQRLRSITALFALLVSIIFVWKILRDPTEHERRRRGQPGLRPSGSDATSRTSTLAQSNEVSSSTGDSSVQDIVHDLFKPVNVNPFWLLFC